MLFCIYLLLNTNWWRINMEYQCFYLKLTRQNNLAGAEIHEADERIERNTKIICSRFKTVSLIRMNRDLSIFIRSEWMWEELNNTMTIIRIIRYFILIIKFIQNISSYKEWCSFTDELERVYSFSWKEEYLFSIEYLH